MNLPASLSTILIMDLVLVTCVGPLDSQTGEYLDSIIVYAHLAGIAPK